MIASVTTHRVEAQLSRASTLPALGAFPAGAWMVGLGVRRDLDGRYPLSGFEGDLWALGDVSVAWALTPSAVLSLRGDAFRILRVEKAADPAVALDPDATDGKTSDAGDFEISLIMTPIGDLRGLAAGGGVIVRLPNSNEAKGIGTNTTDVTLAGVLTWGAASWRVSGLLGVGILEAPLETFEQNDVAVYALEGIVRAPGSWRAGVAVEGRASTRGRVPLGTEDRGSVTVWVERALRGVRADVGLSRGYADRSPDWSLRAGLAIGRGRR